MPQLVHIIDVKSGNLQSLTNAIKHVGDYDIAYIRDAADFDRANADISRLVFPGVGNYGHFVRQINERHLAEPIRKYIDSGRRIMGICVGLQAFFRSSEESPAVAGLELLDWDLHKFDKNDPLFVHKRQVKAVPHIGWNSVNTAFAGTRALAPLDRFYGISQQDKYYFVHSYAAILRTQQDRAAMAHAQEHGWDFCVAQYGAEEFVAAVAHKGLFATQFHPEKSGVAGLRVLRAFLQNERIAAGDARATNTRDAGLSRRIIACLDVRANDNGDLVVTKGDQYNVREAGGDGEGLVRNLGKPVELATRYYRQGADEVTFLNITSFRNSPIRDLPMLEVLRKAAENIFVPLTVGGGIKDMTDPTTGEAFPAVKVADLYFRSGADKVSIGSEAVAIAEAYYASGKQKTGTSAIETISACFGNQAVVISVDPKRVYVASPDATRMAVLAISDPANYGPNGEKYCYYQVSSQGGRRFHDLGALELCQACEDLGAGEILLNLIDYDGSNNGYNLELLRQVKLNVSIPVIASSGAGKPEHFQEVFEMDCGIDAALGAGMFHRGEYEVNAVKLYLRDQGMNVRLDVGVDL
ncbi:imidazole glycerol phosphate synthase HisHF [Metschnikowia bicuspidata var. bicuspidata NRRL YB-4993]|uniref:Imidazole glycerol phosphate synthase hisHF n=1 Tax=Metschnikowia bicuspidata var. bicuspidata NRRL YB-4993 TaxID=869754 RepID=A0A1A0H9X5_9ASCO|nr:imidazole glycerol phosphate synthase HisHF [Metschnikowia bicuspidata var. bicuspidata NRRL YB-4993]OBA20816.1 imidazole glycerol phosphate synthase HisHF [Metschnikowia bicuspidata var. bicuspidata NRRL YB-4993]